LLDFAARVCDAKLVQNGAIVWWKHALLLSVMLLNINEGAIGVRGRHVYLRVAFAVEANLRDVHCVGCRVLVHFNAEHAEPAVVYE
jgi:hypothetical protein